MTKKKERTKLLNKSVILFSVGVVLLSALALTLNGQMQTGKKVALSYLQYQTVR